MWPGASAAPSCASAARTDADNYAAPPYLNIEPMLLDPLSRSTSQGAKQPWFCASKFSQQIELRLLRLREHLGRSFSLSFRMNDRPVRIFQMRKNIFGPIENFAR